LSHHSEGVNYYVAYILRFLTNLKKDGKRDKKIAGKAGLKVIESTINALLKALKLVKKQIQNLTDLFSNY